MMMSLLVPILTTLFLVFIQGLLLQTACTVAGERKPDYGHALATVLLASLAAGIGSFAFSWTIGLLLWLFSSWLSWLATLAFGLSITAAIYRPRLGLTAPSALGVAVLHALMGSVVSAALWALVRYLQS